MKKISRIVFEFCAVATVLFSLLTPSIASAVVPPKLPTSSSALDINPRITAQLNPGQTVTGHLQVSNQDSSAPLDLTLRVIDFSFLNQTGTPKLYTDPSIPQTTWSLKPYLSVPSTLNIGASGTKTYAYTIKIPKNLGAGSYYSAIEYASGLGDSGNVGLSAAGVTLVFVTVSGTAKENVTLEKFGPYNETSSTSAGNFLHYITTTKPNSLAMTVTNHGNVTEAPAGTIELYKWGKSYATIQSINPNSLITLIGQTRLYVPCIKNQTQAGPVNSATPTDANACVASNLSPGHYTAKLIAYYGQNGNPTQQILATSSFWYIPLWMLVAILAAFVYVIYRGVKLYRKFKSKSSGGGSLKSRRNQFGYSRNRSKRNRFRR